MARRAFLVSSIGLLLEPPFDGGSPPGIAMAKLHRRRKPILAEPAKYRIPADWKHSFAGWTPLRRGSSDKVLDGEDFVDLGHDAFLRFLRWHRPIGNTERANTKLHAVHLHSTSPVPVASVPLDV